jgi:hypothetical protein
VEGRRDYWTRVGGGGNDDGIDELMNRAACLSMECISKHEAAIIAIVEASEGKDQIYRDEIININARRLIFRLADLLMGRRQRAEPVERLSD